MIQTTFGLVIMNELPTSLYPNESLELTRVSKPISFIYYMDNQGDTKDVLYDAPYY